MEYTNEDWEEIEAWEKLRVEAHIFMKEKEESLLKRWLEKIGCNLKEPIGYYRDSWHHTMEIYTTRPGPLIGKAGIHVDELKQMLSEEFRGEWNVKFIEIRGGFVNI